MTQDQNDPLRLLEILGVAPPSRVSQVTDGWGDTQLWRVEHDDRWSILRIYPPHLRHVRDRELATMQAITTVPTPRIEAVGEPNGLPSMLLSWCAGTTLLAALSAAPEEARSLGITFGRAQARIHANSVPSTLREQLVRDWIDWGTEGAGPIDRALRAQPVPRESILHLDYHPLNVLIEHGEITGVIDWTNALIGDVRADFARTYSLLSWLPLPPGLEAKRGAHARHQFRQGWAHGYHEEAGLLPDLALYLAWAALVLVRDLSSKIGKPGFWITAGDLQRMHQVRARWSRRAGLLPEDARL
ncbi:MAG TPA: phosphotransferase [Nitrolancea sp.]|nr:phosphotransferase [Nitrolancea sp.]